MEPIILYHGSDHAIPSPNYQLGKPNNDYGKGFYLTKEIELAKEWAAKKDTKGIVSEYTLNLDGLKILNLIDKPYNVLNWIALLINNRTFVIDDDLSNQAKKYLLDNFLIDISNYDLIIGYRADDSYFSFAQSFLNNTISLKKISKALTLGKLGIQYALISEKSFSHLKYVTEHYVDNEQYFKKFSERDSKARTDYKNMVKNNTVDLNEIYMIDILREEIKNNDPRIQRTILK